MIFRDIQKLLDATVVCGVELLDNTIEQGFASDLMSDVLTLRNNQIVLLTGLCNIQTIRTAEMADIRYLILVRGKIATEDMIELAKENDMIILQTAYSMFRAVGLLWTSGMKPLY